MVSARHHDEVISGDHFDGKAGIAEFFLGTFDKAKFDVTADDGLNDLGRVSDGNHQRHAGIGLVEIDQSRWQEMIRYCLAGLDHEPPTGKTRKLAHCQFNGLGAVDQVARLIKQQLASFGYGNATPHAVKQLRAELPSNEAVLAAVLAGAGATILSERVCGDAIRAGTLKRLPISAAPRGFYAVQHADRYRSRAVSALLEILRKHAAL